MISIKDLHFSYSKNQALFQGLHLNLELGKIYGLLGKNGTGKSSLLKLINGVIFPNGGDVSVNSFQSSSRTPRMLEQIFFLSEDFYLPPVTPHNFAKAYGSFYPAFDKVKFEEIMNAFEVPQNQKLTKLSLGQKKKIAIAFGLATNAKYLLLDEPTNGLDIPSKSQFRKVIAAGFRDDQVVVISTHQIRDLSNLIESVIIIEDGKIIFNKDVFEIEEKILFAKSLSRDTFEASLYSELVGAGYIHMMANHDKEPCEVELEVLFNAILSDKELVQKQF